MQAVAKVQWETESVFNAATESVVHELLSTWCSLLPQACQFNQVQNLRPSGPDNCAASIMVTGRGTRVLYSRVEAATRACKLGPSCTSEPAFLTARGLASKGVRPLSRAAPASKAARKPLRAAHALQPQAGRAAALVHLQPFQGSAQPQPPPRQRPLCHRRRMSAQKCASCGYSWAPLGHAPGARTAIDTISVWALDLRPWLQVPV